MVSLAVATAEFGDALVWGGHQATGATLETVRLSRLGHLATQRPCFRASTVDRGRMEVLMNEPGPTPAQIIANLEANVRKARKGSKERAF